MGWRSTETVEEFFPGRAVGAGPAPAPRHERPGKPDAILTDMAETRALLAAGGCRVPEDVGLAALSILDADAGIDQHPEEIRRVVVLQVILLINEQAHGVPPIFWQTLVEGAWVDGATLPKHR